MIDFCTVVVLDFELKKVYLQANSLQCVPYRDDYCGIVGIIHVHVYVT